MSHLGIKGWIPCEPFCSLSSGSCWRFGSFGDSEGGSAVAAGTKWVGMHAAVEGQVKVACGRCGETGWMTADQWQESFAALDPEEQRLRAKFGGVSQSH